MDRTIKTAAESWLNGPVIANSDKQEIRDLLPEGNEPELTDRFYQELEFGTGGLRGTIGAGLNRMNVYTVEAAARSTTCRTSSPIHRCCTGTWWPRFPTRPSAPWASAGFPSSTLRLPQQSAATRHCWVNTPTRY